MGNSEDGIAPGTEFQNIPDDWRCPECGVTKADFVPYEDGEEIPTIDARIVSKQYLNADTLELTIETGEVLEYIPGQYITFAWEDGDGTFNRSYSIAKSDGKRYTFVIKL